ncbi:MAG: hypothetical protein ACI9YT_000550 [Halobacteriales archaeon]|jgi:hypothetical protein
MGRLSHTLHGVAAVTAALESSDVEIVDLEMVARTDSSDAEGDAARLTLRIPDGVESMEQASDDDVFRVEIQPRDVEDADRLASVHEGSGGATTEGAEAASDGGRRSASNGASPAAEARSDGATDDGGPADESPGTPDEPPAESDEPIPCRHDECEETFETERGMKIHFTKTHLEGADEPDDGEDDRPAYADPAKLRRVYEQHDTFEGMTDALDVEVTPATVRRHMIKYGIYDPAANDEPDGSAPGGDRSPESEDATRSDRQAAAGGTSPDNGSADAQARSASDDDSADTIRELLAERDRFPGGLPEDDALRAGVTVPALVEAIVSSRTVHEVSTHLDVDRDAARAALEEAELLDLVQGRLDAATSREERERRVAARIEELRAHQQRPGASAPTTDD